MGTCIVTEKCTAQCVSTGKPCTRYGFVFKSLFNVERWFSTTPGKKTLWRAQRGEWVEVATSTSARVLADRFGTGAHVVMPAGIDPNGTVETPLEIAPADGLLFA